MTKVYLLASDEESYGSILSKRHMRELKKLASPSNLSFIPIFLNGQDIFVEIKKLRDKDPDAKFGLVQAFSTTRYESLLNRPRLDSFILSGGHFFIASYYSTQSENLRHLMKEFRDVTRLPYIAMINTEGTTSPLAGRIDGYKPVFNMLKNNSVKLQEDSSNESNAQASQPHKNKDILSDIIDDLINNIENNKNGRCTSGRNSEKVKYLQIIKRAIEKGENLDKTAPDYQQYIQDIMDVCKIKRNKVHFWQTPNSVKEYVDLLKQHNIECSFTASENNALMPHQK